MSCQHLSSSGIDISAGVIKSDLIESTNLQFSFFLLSVSFILYHLQVIVSLNNCLNSHWMSTAVQLEVQQWQHDVTEGKEAEHPRNNFTAGCVTSVLTFQTWPHPCFITAPTTVYVGHLSNMTWSPLNKKLVCTQSLEMKKLPGLNTPL